MEKGRHAHFGDDAEAVCGATDARGITLRGLAARATIRKSDFGIKGNPLEPNVAEEIQLVVDVELHDH